ncbi:MAG: hypothetical protein KGJ45_11620 [Elusimicrobia bacterium]|nr:hypothetical protein [Elusimicrobiota bacterium]
MLTLVLSWLGQLLGGPFATAAVNAYRDKLQAENSADKIAASLAAQKAQIDEQREQLEQATLVAEEGRWGPWIRWGFAAPFVLFNAKVIVWDRMLHRGVTDPLSPDLVQLEAVIVAAYFGHSAIAIAGRAFARRR